MKRRLPNTMFYIETNDFNFISTPTEVDMEVGDRFVTCTTRDGNGQNQNIKGIKTFENDTNILGNLTLEKSLIFDNSSKRGFTFNNQIDHNVAVGGTLSGSTITGNSVTIYSKNTSDENKTCVSEILLSSDAEKVQPANSVLNATYTYKPLMKLSLKEVSGDTTKDVTSLILKKDVEEPYYDSHQNGVVEIPSYLYVDKDIVFGKTQKPGFDVLTKSCIKSGWSYVSSSSKPWDSLALQVGEDDTQNFHKRAYIELDRDFEFLDDTHTTSFRDNASITLGIYGYKNGPYIQLRSNDKTSEPQITENIIEIGTTNGYIDLHTDIFPHWTSEKLGSKNNPFSEIHGKTIHGLLPNPEGIQYNVLPKGAIVLLYVYVNLGKRFEKSIGDVFTRTDEAIYELCEAVSTVNGFIGNHDRLFSGTYIALCKVACESQSSGTRQGCVILVMKKS